MTKYITLTFLFIYACGFSQDRGHVIVEQQLPSGYVKDASVDYTNELQRIINRYDSITMPNFPLLINDNGISISSNKFILFQEKSRLILKPSNKTHYALLNINKAVNVELHNAVLIGDRDEHVGSKGEWGMGIRIQGSSNVKIINADISNFWGDGIYITRDKKTNSQNVLIDHSTIKKNRRNGVSIISGDNIIIQNTSFIHNYGTKPMAGIDIEPNTPEDILGYIKVNNINTTQNRVGIQVSMMHYPSEKEQSFKIDVENIKSNEDQHGLLVRDFYRINKYGNKAIPLNGVVNYNNIRIKQSTEEPIKYFNSKKGYEYGPIYNFYNIQIERDKNSRKWMNKTRIKNELKLRGFNVESF